MQNYDKVKENLKIIQDKVIDSPFYNGIEIAALKKDGKYTDTLCIRVLTNSKKIKHKDLNIPETIDDIVIVVEYRMINLH